MKDRSDGSAGGGPARGRGKPCGASARLSVDQAAMTTQVSRGEMPLRGRCSEEGDGAGEPSRDSAAADRLGPARGARHSAGGGRGQDGLEHVRGGRAHGGVTQRQ